MSATKTTSTINETTATKASSIREMTPEQTAEAIKSIARNIRETSAKMREAVRAIRQSGAIDELTEAVREATIAARDTAIEISDAAKEMRERGVIKDTANVIEETTMVARDTVQSLKDTTSPKTPETIEQPAVDITTKTEPQQAKKKTVKKGAKKKQQT
jgi:hypothetical protein